MARNELVEVVGPVWSELQVLTALRVPAEMVASRRESSTILALATSDGDIVYPVSQFNRRQGRVEVKPALRPFLQALRGHAPWAVAVLLHTPALELDGLTPLDWEAGGGATEALSGLAKAVAREWAASTVLTEPP